MFKNLLLRAFCRCFGKKYPKHSFFIRAPEPTDIIWEHLDVSSRKRIRRMILTFIAALLMIGVSFGIIYLIRFLSGKVISGVG